MKKFTLLFLVLSYNCFAQKEANIWYFGGQAGVDFNSGSPVALTNCSPSFYPFEGVGTLSDSSGNLLFYTDGNNVFNANHVFMPNGTGLLSNTSSTQTGLSVKQPGNDSIYYVFHINFIYFVDSIYYSTIDMSLNGGLGNVVQKNLFLRGNTTEKVTAVNHSNGTDIWIVTHDYNSDAFVAYLLTSSGLSATPVISNTGNVFTNALGYLKASPQGNKLASADFNESTYSIYDFDNVTGIVSNANVSPANYLYAYGCEWSPDGTKLYGGQENSNDLWQFDVSAGLNVWNTATLIYETSSIEYEALQLGPDGKIYTSRYQTAWLGVINDPDSAGAACNYVDDGVDLQGRLCYLGLPNYNASIFNSQLLQSALSASDTNICENSCINFFNASSGNPTSWLWNFPGASTASSTDENPTNICYSLSGSYDVTLIVTDTLGSDTISLPGFISVSLNPSPSVTPTGNVLTSSSASSYQWYLDGNIITGATSQSYTADQAGVYTVVVTDANGCTGTVDYTYSPAAFIANDTAICEKFCIDFLDSSVNNPVSWLWSFPGANPSSSADQNPTNICYDGAGSYDVTLITTNANGINDTLTLTDYITVFTNPLAPVISQNGNILTSSSATGYQWQLNLVNIPGATNQSYEITQSGLYTVVIGDENGCTAQSSIDATMVGISGVDESFSVNVFPNPSDGIFTVTLSTGNKANVQFTITNTLGQILSEKTENMKSENFATSMDLRNLSAGIYYMEIKVNAAVMTFKLMRY